jgi:hypothetical protein
LARAVLRGREQQVNVRPKVKAAGLGGAIAAILFAVLRNNGVDVDTEVFGLFSVSDAVVALSAFIAGYMKTENA